MFIKHATIERNTILLAALTLLTVAIGGLVEIVPLFTIETTIERVEGMRPYSPLEQVGRNIYVREGCYVCHSQQIRPLRDEVERYGHYSLATESMYDHPFQWGSKRTGPDLHRVGGKYPHLWHVRHMEDPRLTTPNSIMPKYGWLLTKDVDFSKTQKKVEVSMMLGVPYKPWEAENAVELAKKQAKEIADEVASQDANYQGLEDKQIIALVAYLQRLGVDIKKEEK